MGKNILITGASGLIGTRLTRLLQQRGHAVSHIGRTKQNKDIPEYIWDIELGIMDPRAVASADVIIHLAGAGVADERWTKTRKDVLVQSRVKSTELLYTVLRKGSYPVKTVVAGSAIGYYGFANEDKVFVETDMPGSDFLAKLTEQWEEQSDKIAALGIRVVKIRTGVVLAAEGGALKSLAKPVKIGFGAALGDGKQMMSWIHIDDLCMMFCKAAEDAAMTGAYNGVAPQAVSNKELTKAVARVLHRPFWLPNVPAFALKLALGEMAGIVINGSRVSSGKIEQAGFSFRHPNLEEALNNIYS